MSRLFVDMDGTLSVFRKIDAIEELYEQGFFISQEPHQNVVDAVKLFIKSNPETEVYILLNEWSPPAHGIKLMNGINHTKGTWKSDKVFFDRTPEEIVMDIESIMCLQDEVDFEM